MFEEGKSYKHRNMIDAYFTVLSVLSENDGDIGLEVEWMHKNGSPFPTPPEDIIIVKDQVRNYREIRV